MVGKRSFKKQQNFIMLKLAKSKAQEKALLFLKEGLKNSSLFESTT